MNTKDLIRLGVPQGAALKSGMEFIVNFIGQGGDSSRLEEEIGSVIAKPDSFLGDPLRETFARDLYAPAFKQRDELAPWHQWGSGLEPEAVKQMANACALPVSVAGALMPDAHLGYGLPIGGVLATEHCVIPYAVGVDIACRMRLTVYDRKASTIAGQKDRLANIMEDEIRKLFEDEEDAENLETVPRMECQAFEHHDYLVFMFHDLRDWMLVLQLMGVREVDYSITRTTKKIGIGRVIHGKHLLELCRRAASSAALAGTPAPEPAPGDPEPQQGSHDDQPPPVPDGHARSARKRA